MTVKDYKETACATASVIDDDIELIPNQNGNQQDSEHLLGRVLAGNIQDTVSLGC